MSFEWIDKHTAFYRFPSATNDQLDLLKRTTGAIFPPEIYEFLRLCNGGEGFIGEEFYRLYSVEQLLSLNPAYGVDEFMPGFVLIGSNGGGESYLLDARHTPAPVFRIPFIPMIEAYGSQMALSVSVWQQGLAAISPAMSIIHTPSSRTFGKEIHEINPIVFGGSPTDPKNRALVPLEQHAEIVVWWNRTFRRVSAQ